MHTAGWNGSAPVDQLLKAEGMVSTLAAVFPAECVEIYTAQKAGDHDRARGLEQVFAHEMRQLPIHVTHAQVDARLAKVQRQELCMAIRHVQQGHIAGRGQVVQVGASGGTVAVGAGRQTHASCGASAQYMQEFTLG